MLKAADRFESALMRRSGGTMRDFDRLEELSSTVQAGLEANDVIWAIDQALAGAELDKEATHALEAGRDILKALAEPGQVGESEGLRRSQRMAGGDGVGRVRRVVIEVVVKDSGEGTQIDVTEILRAWAEALDAVAKAGTVGNSVEALEGSLGIFAAISEVRLGQGNGIVRANKEQASWLSRTMTSPSC
jgi:hypothetical protein